MGRLNIQIVGVSGYFASVDGRVAIIGTDAIREVDVDIVVFPERLRTSANSEP